MESRERVRHISPFGNPIKEDNPFSVAAIFPRRRRIPSEISFSEKTLPRRFTSCRSAERRRTVRFRECRTRHDRRIFSSSILSSAPSSSSSPSIPPRFPSDRSPLFHLGFPPIISTFTALRSLPFVRHPAIFLRWYVTRRSSADINRCLRRYARQIFPSSCYYAHLTRVRAAFQRARAAILTAFSCDKS